jgi:hypothetical protein
MTSRKKIKDTGNAAYSTSLPYIKKAATSMSQLYSSSSEKLIDFSRKWKSTNDPKSELVEGSDTARQDPSKLSQELGYYDLGTKAIEQFSKRISDNLRAINYFKRTDKEGANQESIRTSSDKNSSEDGTDRFSYLDSGMKYVNRGFSYARDRTSTLANDLAESETIKNLSTYAVEKSEKVQNDLQPYAEYTNTFLNRYLSATGKVLNGIDYFVSDSDWCPTEVKWGIYAVKQSAHLIKNSREIHNEYKEFRRSLDRLNESFERFQNITGQSHDSL